MNENQKKIENYQAELRVLHSKLQADTSDIGDWKIAKCMEYQLCGLETPYDVQDLNAQRQKVRDKINSILEEIAKLETES